MMNSNTVSLYAMGISIIALSTQVVFGVLSTRRAIRETDRQIAETKKQEKLQAINAEEIYKGEVRAWGRAVVRQMSMAQQLCKIDPAKFTTSDYNLERGNTVAALRGFLDKAKWLFPNLALPSSEGRDWQAAHKRGLSALETILHVYHALDTVKEDDSDNRKRSVINIRRLRKRFVTEMRKAVDPQVRGDDIARIMDEVEEEIQEAKEAAKVNGKEKDPSITSSQYNSNKKGDL
ncbi:MAG: hypothetical protein V3U57_00175 [Robiginitomaculum sp.]